MDRVWSSPMLKTPQALIDRKNEYVETLVRRGATTGAERDHSLWNRMVNTPLLALELLSHAM